MAQLSLTPDEARRLAVAAQCLEAPQPAPTRAHMLDTIRQITCVQLDPINAVARNPLLILFSRLGNYDPADLYSLLWEDKALFEYWAHAASIVLTDDYPFFHDQMQDRDPGNGFWLEQYLTWLNANASFRQEILDEMRARGPLFAEEITAQAGMEWEFSGWSSGRAVTRMIDVMWTDGEVTVTRRTGDGFGTRKQWGLLEVQVPAAVGHTPWPVDEVVRRAAERSLLALGVGRLRDVRNYFIRNRYPNLQEALALLEAMGRIVPVTVGDWPGPWYIHRDNLPLLERLRRGDWHPQTVLLSPFDNLIADRDRTELLFDFFYRIEIYVPAAKRQYGYYVMPILRGERLIGRVDLKMDRKAKTLQVNNIYTQPGYQLAGETKQAVYGALDSLGEFLAAEQVALPPA